MTTYDYVTQDVCHDCQYAVLRSEKSLDEKGGFARRYVCGSVKRVDHMELSAIRAIAAKDYPTAAKMLSKLQDRDCDGMLECEDCVITPPCYSSERRPIARGGSPC